jgi:outer membrane protein OmpA-like peptidoglycan-associated protein
MSLLLAAAAAAAVAAQAQERLGDRPSQLRSVETGKSSLSPAPASGELATTGPSSGLRPAGGPSSSLRLSEVPPSRLAVTQAALRELAVRDTPQRALVVTLPADVLFDFDSASLRPDAQATLDRTAELLRSYARAPLEVHGHTDAKGSDAYNDALSLRRAQAVAQRLQRDAGGRTLQVQGFGERVPVAPNTHPDGSDDPAGRQRNRRVEIVIQPLR